MNGGVFSGKIIELVEFACPCELGTKKNGGFIDHHLLRYIYDCHYESNNNSNSNSHHLMIFTSVIALYMTGAADTSFASHSMLCSLD